MIDARLTAALVELRTATVITPIKPLDMRVRDALIALDTPTAPPHVSRPVVGVSAFQEERSP